MILYSLVKIVILNKGGYDRNDKKTLNNKEI